MIAIQGQRIANHALLIKEQANTIQSLCTKIRKQPEASSSGLAHLKSKVDIFADTNKYDGSFAKFNKWWAKMKGWLNINHHIIEEASYEAVDTVFSQLKGPKAGPFTQVQLQKD